MTNKATIEPRDPSSPPAKLSQRWRWASKGMIGFLMQQGVENPDVISLAAGLVDPGSLPVSTTRSAFQAMMADDALARTALQYGTTSGAMRLRKQLVSHLANREGMSPDDPRLGTDRFVLTTGSQQLLSLVAEVLFDPGDICLVASPTYFVFLGVLDGVGARAIPVATDENGMQPAALESELQRLKGVGELDRVKLVYLVSDFENPSGYCLSDDRRQAVLEIARRWSREHRLFVLEDAAYRELRYDGSPQTSLLNMDPDGEHVIHAGTFSKSFSPGLRVGFGVVPADLHQAVCVRKGNEDFGSANFNQHLLATVFEQGLYGPHVESVRDAYRVKRDAMLTAADRYFSDIPGVHWMHPEGGLYVWMSLPEEIATGFDSELFHHTVHETGMMYVPGEICFASGDPNGDDRPTNHMRLSFGVQDPAGIDEAMKRLATSVRAMR
ncbi:aminotransferase-like domain-containing protein [Thalassoroseus pseudoceratinae]|uniref:aminotransferase-like domain-containing protein n=1 Tax=Thalassoroseus pseudoceratinae TaxID=2713176 RepID=UPI0014223ED3|nr:PLP-dependent aminotransferase family protein [Thalassoroseus pseudoceratinae]